MSNPPPRLLLIDDGRHYEELIRTRIPEFELIRPDATSERHAIEDGPAAIAFLESYDGPLDAVLLDMQFDLPDERLFPLVDGASPRRTRRFQGVAILREIRARFPHLPVVLLTAQEDLNLVDLADGLVSQSMTYVLDGNDLDTLRIRINSALADSAQAVEDAHILWGSDPVMKSLRRRMTVLARGRMPVILEGETGTGKSWLAEKFIHAHSGRTGPFVVLDLSTVPRDLVSAHLFGAVKGAYTGAVETRKGVFEIAHEGTLFIDEIQNAPLEVQKQLLLVLQDSRIRPIGSNREIMVDVKVIAASNRPLDAEVARGHFRSDLYMRLSPATRIHIPPLRKRPRDLRFLAGRFVTRAGFDPDIGALRDEVAAALGLSPDLAIELNAGREKRSGSATRSIELGIPKPVWKMLEEHNWPGNIRELEMLMYNIVTFTLVATVDAIRQGITISSSSLQVDPGLVGELLKGTGMLIKDEGEASEGEVLRDDQIAVTVTPSDSLNGVANSLERQVFLSLYRRCGKDFSQMAHQLLGDKDKARAVRLRFNQLGLKVREVDRS